MAAVCRYYLSGTDAYRLKLLLPLTPAMLAAHEMQRLAHEQGAEQPSTTEPMQHGGQSAVHDAECGCSHHGAADGGKPNQGSAQLSEPASGDAAVANGSRPHPAGSDNAQTRKPARKPKSRRR